MTITRIQLIEYGLTLLPDRQPETWAYKNIGLRYRGTDCLLFDPHFPQYTLRVSSVKELEAILRKHDAGQRICEILMQRYPKAEEQQRRFEQQQANPPLLEDFRFNHFGGCYLSIVDYSTQPVFMAYERHAQSAFGAAMSDISELEREKSQLLNGLSSQAISSWFLAMESYVNVLIKLCCLKKGTAFEPYRRQDFGRRILSLIHLLELDTLAFSRSGILSRVNEFLQFRNELFHDRHFGEELAFKHTAFSPVPNYHNSVDVLQALLVLLEVTSTFRFAIEGLDTMPRVVMVGHEYSTMAKIDAVYAGMLCPFFEAVLLKHGLRTGLVLEPRPVAALRSRVFAAGEVRYKFVLETDERFEFYLNETPTNLGRDYYHSFLRGLALRPGSMELGGVEMG
jgi:hypothetical protein